MLLIVLLVAGAGAFAYASTPVPTMKEDALVATTTVYYSDGTTVMGELNNGIDRKPLTEEQMPQAAKDAAVASEDRTFYENKGVSVTGIGRAVWGVITGNSDLGGGSTITQQYVKNITGNDQRAYTRKATEAIQALKVDQKYSKDQILTSYLNTVYFGRGAYGIGAATEAYFGPDVDPTQLTHEQAALLIGILPAPSAWDPATDTGGNAQKRYTYVMGAMQGMGTVSADEVAANPTMPAVAEQQKPQWFSGPNGYVLSQVVSEVASKELSVATLAGGAQIVDTTDAVATSGLQIVSTVDAGLQAAAVETMQDTDVYPDRNRPATVRAGLVSIDPQTGGVKAMYSGDDPKTQFDSVTYGAAQAGSTFKPFTLLAALESGDVTLSDTFDGSSPQTIDGYTVPNYGSGRGEQFGDINLVKATADSVNTVYVRLNDEIGPEATAQVAEQLGAPVAPSETGLLSNVLGTSTVKPIQMAQAYAALANGGDVRTAHFISTVKQGEDTRYSDENLTPTHSFDPDAVADTVYAMQAVTKSGGTAASVGKAFGKRPVAGKTGTTNGNKAAWFNGFTPQLETAVVLYNSGEKGEQLSLGSWGGVKEVTGGTIPAKIWTSYMTKALKGTDVAQFPKPSRQVSSDPTPTATPTPTPTETATATPTDDPSASPSESPTDGETGATDGPTQDEGDTAQAAGPPSIADRASARIGAAAQAAQGGPGQGRGAGGPAGGPGAGRAQG